MNLYQPERSPNLTPSHDSLTASSKSVQISQICSKDYVAAMGCVFLIKFLTAKYEKHVVL